MEAAAARANGGQALTLEVIGHEDFDFVDGLEANTDVWAHKDFAYVGTFDSPAGCANGAGVKIVDVSDPANPRFVGRVQSPKDTRANDVKVAAINTDSFSGDVLAFSNEPTCGPRRGRPQGKRGQRATLALALFQA